MKANNTDENKNKCNGLKLWEDVIAERYENPELKKLARELTRESTMKRLSELPPNPYIIKI